MISRDIGTTYSHQFWNGSGWTIKTLEVVKGGTCRDCCLYRDTNHCFFNNKNSSCGACSSTFRKDNKKVHFIVKEVHSYSNFNK